MKRVIIDCDPGIDDSLALILALKSPEIHVEMITTVTGNLHSDRCAENVLKILYLMDRLDITVGKGSMLPLTGNYPHDPFSHGGDGLGNTNLPLPDLDIEVGFAPQLIIDIVKQFPGEITFVATGPLTNLAIVLMHEPKVAEMIKDIVMIGGSFGFNEYAYKNATGGNPSSEWNIYVDPEAARIVFNSELKITAVGLDVVTHPRINIRDLDLEKLRQSKNTEAKYFLNLLDYAKQQQFQSYCVLIDSMAIAALIDPLILNVRDVYLDVALDGELTRGQTVVDHRERFQWKHLPKLSASYDAEFDRFLDLLVDRICM